MRTGDHRVTVEASRQEVWRLIERAENVGTWWPRQVVPIQGDGQITPGKVWDTPSSPSGPPIHTQIDEVDPERKMVFQFWLPRGERPAQTWTLLLKDEGNHCQVRLLQALDWEMMFKHTYGPVAPLILLVALPLMLLYFIGFTLSSFLRNSLWPFVLMSDLRKLKKMVESR